MPPQQHNQPTPQPQRSFTPHAPHYGYGYNAAPQQHANGQYEVVPPMPPKNNTGGSGHNAYEFIVNPNMPKKRAYSGGGSLLKRIAIVGGALVVLVIVAGIVFSALTPKGAAPGLTLVAERQQEIIRIATAATIQADGQDTKNFVTNVNLSITSSQQQVLSYLGSHGTKLKPAVLALDKNTQTDTLLTSAVTTNSYDTAVAQNLASQLQTYESLLQTTFKQTSNPASKQLLQTCFNGVAELLKQAGTLPANSNT